MSERLQPGQWLAIDTALADNRLIEAIRLFREATGVSLFEAKTAVEARSLQCSGTGNSEPQALASAPPVRIPASRRNDLHWRPHGTTLWQLATGTFEQHWLYLPAESPQDFWRNCLSRVAALDDEPEELEQAHGPLAWASCLAEAGRAQLHTDTEFWFSDLESCWRTPAGLEPAALEAWQTLLQLVDRSAIRRDRLPWWLQASADWCAASVGALRPAECGEVVKHATRLRQTLSLQRTLAADFEAILSLLREAADQGDWVIGMEPGT